MDSSTTTTGKPIHGVSFFCTKLHKWRGPYVRIITIGNDGFATYSADKGSLTNSWEWKDIENIAADKPGSQTFTITIRNGKNMSKMSFRSWMIAEIVSEARSHLQCDLSKPAPYLFTGTKVARKCEEPKEIEFVVKSGYVLMRFVKENRTKLIPIYYITDVSIMSEEGQMMLEICGTRRYYQLRERFGFITALVNEMNLCGIEKDARQRLDTIVEDRVIITKDDITQIVFSVKRIHNPQSLLSSMESKCSGVSEEERGSRYLLLTEEFLEEVIDGDEGYMPIHSIPFSSIVGYYQEIENTTDFYIQFQSRGYLRLLAFSCDHRDDLFCTLYSILKAPSSVFYPFLPNNALRFHGTKDHIMDMGNTCIRSIQLRLHENAVSMDGRHPSSSGLDDGLYKHFTPSFGFESLIASCEAFVINSRYFAKQYDLSLEEKKTMVTQVTAILCNYLDSLKKGSEVCLRDICVLFLFLHYLIRMDSGFTPSFLVSSLEGLFSSACECEVPCLQLCFLQFLTDLSSQSSNQLLSSFASSTVLLESLIKTAFNSSITLHAKLSIHLLIQLMKEQSALPPPLPVYEAVSTFITGYMSELYSRLLAPSSLQTSFFHLFYHLILYSTQEIRQDLQRVSYSSDVLLILLRESLFNTLPLQQLVARALLVVVSFQNTTVIAFLQRILPREFSRVIHTPCTLSSLGDLIDCDGHLPLGDSLSFRSLALTAFPANALNFPAFFSLFMSDMDSYRIVWGAKQREEVNEALCNEIEKWKSRNQDDIWNMTQFFIPFPSYDQHLQLYGYFLGQLSQIPLSVHCSNLETLCNETAVHETPAMKLVYPQALLLSLYSRFLAAESVANQVVLLRCMKIVYGLNSTICGEFFDCFHLLELYQREIYPEVQVCLVELIQCLCLNDKNKDFFCQHASHLIPLLCERLLTNHSHFNEDFCESALDLFFALLQHSSHAHMYPPSEIVCLLTTPEHLLQFVNMFFLPSEHLGGYLAHLLLALAELSNAILPVLSETPLVDCLLKLYPQWKVVHIQLLKLVVMEKNTLAGVLPSALLYALEILSEERFITLFQSDTSSPTLIWSQSMRDNLLAIVDLHIHSYQQQLAQDPSAPYLSLPLPHIPYPELADEVYCGKYYLKQLLKSSRDIVVKSPKALIMSIKNEWLREGKRKGYKIDVERAMEMLGLTEIPRSNDMVFQKVWDCWREAQDEAQREDLILAEDLITGYLVTATSPVFPRLLTLIQIQKELYLLYASKLKSFLYPSYEMVAAQALLLIQHNNRDEASELCLELCKLIYYSCSCSLDNSELFVKKNGVVVLSNLLQWNDVDIKAERPRSYDILYFILLTLSHLSQILSVHSILIETEDITASFVVYLSYSIPAALKSLSVDYFINLIIESTFRSSLMHLSVNLLNSAIPLLFIYNRDQEESREKQLNEQCIRLSTSLKHSSRSSSTSDLSDLALSAIPGQLPCDDECSHIPLKELSYEDMKCDNNMLARHVVQLLSVTANNWSTAISVLNSLLTKSLVSLLLELNVDSFLTILNSDFYSSPFIIWSSEMRVQLLGFLQEQLETSLAGENRFIENASHFVFTAIQHELIIADVYVRVFNEQNPKDFVKGPKYLSGILQYLSAQRSESDSVMKKKSYVNEMLLSIDLLLTNNAELESVFQTPDDLMILFSFLLPQRENDQDVWDLSSYAMDRILHVLTMLTENPRISVMIVQSQFIDILLRLLYQHLPDYFSDLFGVLFNLCLHAEGKESLLVHSNVWLYLIHCALVEETEIASQAMTVLRGWLAIEVVRSRLILLLRHFLPSYMIRAIEEGRFVQLVSSTTVTAEILWNTAMKTKLVSAVTLEYQKYRIAFLEGSEYHLEGNVEYEQIKNELVVGGVFIRVYIEGEFHLQDPYHLFDAITEHLLMYIQDEVKQQLKPKNAEEEKKIREEVALYEAAFSKCCDIENSPIMDYFESSGLLEKFIQLWEEMRSQNQLHSPFNAIICLVLTKVSENMKCLSRIVSTKEVLHILLECLRLNTKNCSSVASFIYLLFKARTTELCKFLDDVNVISSLIACFKNPIEVTNEDGSENKEKESEILVYIQKTLVCIEKVQCIYPVIASQLESNNWNEFKNIPYTI